MFWYNIKTCTLVVLLSVPLWPFTVLWYTGRSLKRLGTVLQKQCKHRFVQRYGAWVWHKVDSVKRP